MHGGGAERVLADLAVRWVRSGNAVAITTLSDATDDDYSLPAEVRRIPLGLMSESTGLVDSVRKNIRRIRTLRRVIRDVSPDCVVSFIPSMNVLTLLAAVGLPTAVIVSERVDPRHHAIGQVWHFLRRLLYRYAAAVVVQTDNIAKVLPQFAPGSRCVVIPNSAPPPAEIPPWTTRRTEIIGVGRLASQKGFDRLIRAFATIQADFPDWRLVILGEGPDRSALQELARELDIADRVEMPGWVSDPQQQMRQGGCFVLSSRYEGFPNALLEAMACGLPAVSFNCDSGPAEIIRPGVDGLLVTVDDVPALAEGMRKLLSDETLRQSMSEHACEVSQRFGVDRIFGLWDQLVSQVSRSPE